MTSKGHGNSPLLRNNIAPTIIDAGTWKKVTGIEQIRDSAVFETYSGGYVLAEDSGYFTVGDVRDERMCCEMCINNMKVHVQTVFHNQ